MNYPDAGQSLEDFIRKRQRNITDETIESHNRKALKPFINTNITLHATARRLERGRTHSRYLLTNISINGQKLDIDHLNAMMSNKQVPSIYVDHMPATFYITAQTSVKQYRKTMAPSKSLGVRKLTQPCIILPYYEKPCVIKGVDMKTNTHTMVTFNKKQATIATATGEASYKLKHIRYCKLKPNDDITILQLRVADKTVHLKVYAQHTTLFKHLIKP